MLTVVLAPLLVGVINRTKAIVGGRNGPAAVAGLLRSAETAGQRRRLQPHHDLGLSRRTDRFAGSASCWPPRSCPSVLAEPLIAFDGDLILLAYLLGLGRLCTVLAALDTGSPFEGMGASREVLFSALAEPALLLGLAAIARDTQRAELDAKCT